MTRRQFGCVLTLAASGVSGCAESSRRLRWSEPMGPMPGRWRGDSVSRLDPAEVGAQLVSLHNQIRAESKLRSLEVNTKLQLAAADHVLDMASRHKMTHEGRDGSTPASRITGRGYRMKRCGENVAFGHFSVEEVMEGWMDSAPHRRNILGSFSQIGTAYATASDGIPFWCVTFGLPVRR